MGEIAKMPTKREPNRTWKNIKSILFLITALLSLVYYAVCVAFAWAGVSWLWLWLLLAVFCLVRFVMLRLELRGKLSPPLWQYKLYRAVFLLCLCFFLAVEGFVISGMRQPAAPGCDYIIVLGAAVRGEAPATPLLLRMQAALAYLGENPETVAIASGGQGRGEDISEAECIRRYLTGNGIEASRILMEDQSSDTMENLRNSYRLIPEGASVGIVSNSFHLSRARLIARLNGHPDAAGIPTPTLLPLGIHYVVREFFAVVKLLIKQI